MHAAHQMLLYVPLEIEMGNQNETQATIRTARRAVSYVVIVLMLVLLSLAGRELYVINKAHQDVKEVSALDYWEVAGEWLKQKNTISRSQLSEWLDEQQGTPVRIKGFVRTIELTIGIGWFGDSCIAMFKEPAYENGQPTPTLEDPRVAIFHIDCETTDHLRELDYAEVYCELEDRMVGDGPALGNCHLLN